MNSSLTQLNAAPNFYQFDGLDIRESDGFVDLGFSFAVLACASKFGQ